jgi:hypothetical protein
MKNYKRYFNRKIAPKAKRGIAFYLALILFFECGLPSVSFALTGGPSQPEVQSFEPIGTSDMVDVFSGDFSYNLPLIDVEGYPINLSYHSGITMDQEASWCGLGWNINPGVVNRNMRGIPDDFRGDAVVKDFNIKENSTIGVSTGFSGELFGLDFASFNARLGIKYNNYNGVGIEKSFNVSVTASNKSGGSGSASLGITSSSDDGLTLAPSLSLSQSMKTGDRSSASVGVSIGASFNSRSGLANFTVGANVSYSVKSVKDKYKKNEDGTDSKEIDKKGKVGGSGSFGGSSSFDIGGSTYSPSLDMPMENLSITGNFTLGGEVFGFDGSLAVGGYFTSQRLATNTISSPAYGYMNSQYGQNNENAMLDFNREKEGSFHLNATYNLPITNNTYDMYSVSGQGTGGSYRPMRSDVGHVFDAAGYSTSDGFQIGVEVGLGNLTHVGVNVTVNDMNSKSNDWSSSTIASVAQSRSSANYPDYEPFYFKEANEKSVDPDQNFYDTYGGDQAARFELDGSTKFNAVTTGNLELSNSTIKSFPHDNYRSVRDRKTQVISTLSNAEVDNGFGLNNTLNSFVAGNPSVRHHIGQISSLGADGKRYIYGLPAYNTKQEETSFAVGVPEGGGSIRPHDAAVGTVTYVPGSDNTVGNKKGLDNYYNNITMPAFAHSYLLTAVVSADYVDNDNIKGPSDGDIGTYVKFNYDEATSNGNPYKWRTPLGKNTAKYNDGLFSNENDDKGSYVYGEKQIYFLTQIETKNYKAIFYKSSRADALGVDDKDGSVSTSGIKQQKLDKIELISKASGSVIKTVHFQYDYELAKPSGSPSVSLPNNKMASDSQTGINQGGKLTLKKVYFTYQNSDKGAFNAYNFKYAGTTSGGITQPGVNPAYDMMSFDRWGNYKQYNSAGMPLDVFPYCNQTAPKSTIDAWSQAWHLTKIELPSGGEINVNYESDDYAYVQNEQATQMYPVDLTTVSDFNAGLLKLGNIPVGTNIDDLLPDDNMLNFRFKMEIANGKYDFVPGYAEIDRGSCNVSGTTANIRLKLVTINDNSGININPIIKATLQFGRLNNSRLIWDQPNASANMSEQVLKALVNSGFFTTISQTAQGPNKYLYNKGRGQNPFTGSGSTLQQCWIKLKNTTGFKYGGGNRVKSVILNDKFDAMVTGADNSEYGQVYDYTTKTNSGKVISSGVAPYEPQIGGEENALKHPFFTETKKLLAPDDEHYVEAPFGESFFPSPGVGYSRISIKNYVPANPISSSTKTLKRHSTGYMVHEFYTAKDFPTITDRTQLEAIHHKNDPFSLASLFHIESKDYMTVSQGFYVELNDMHGKPKADFVYGEDQVSPISSTEYKYKSTPYGNGCSRLENKVNVLYPDGTVKNENIGLFFDAVGDLREQETDGQSFGLNVNVDGFLIAAVPVFIPIPIPSYSSDKTRFRSAVFTKVVQRFGILEQTTANQDGSIVSTKNLAYDAENGQVLLTQLNNNFEDPIYSFKYPAYWHYAGMAAAYKNIDYLMNNVSFNGSGVANISSGNNKFQEGDELEMIQAGNYITGWVTNVASNSIEVQKKNGTLVNGFFDQIKVIRSGARNLLSVDMANITTMVNPLNGIKNNIYDKVIQASAVEFGNRWRTVCECNTTTTGAPLITNPYVNGTKGMWRPVRNYVHLTGRNQNDYDNNTNLRKDGLFTSYTPYYKLNTNGKWGMDPQNWTYASEITEFNPFGQELENVDALGRYSAATFGFNQTMATSVGANSQYKELGFDSFEDYNLSTCADKHFKFGITTDNSTSHTGRNSIKVLANTMVTMEKQIGEQCDKVKMCNGYIKLISSSGGLYTYTIQNGTGPYNLDAQVVSGSGNIQPSGNGFTISPSGNNYIVKITVIDESGCTYTKLIKYPYNN